ncbi:peptidylprolyl isomerase [Aureibaculum sp. A20]|uniref:Peptidylprolyl isomerase n=2 Tax=Aureibaculum flavum TaxID=2795986 RepID=A0ABS0WTQ8_9FLAO|nr:peptidylprolyl isomerase [Aureibaculum flavum]
MPLKIKNFKYINMLKKFIVLILLGFTFTTQAQDSTQTQKRVKLDGVATVVGKNIVLESEIAAYKLEFEQQSEGKVDISDCEMLEQIMERKLLSHHAVIDSVVVTEAEINQNVEQKIAYFLQQLGSEEKVYNYYGFNDMADLRKEFNEVEKEALMVQKMQRQLTEEVDVTPEEVRNYYKSLEDENNLPEIGAEIELQQIVMYAEPSKEEVERVIDKLKEIKKDVENGSNFKMKAILYSEDPGVTENSGLYTITRESQFVTEFKEAAFSLDEGEMSEPFKSDFGYHILQVEKVKGKQRDARHLLMQPEVTNEQKEKVKDSLENIRTEILKLKISYDDAVVKYSEEKETKANKGLLMNPETNDSKFDLTRMDPTLYARVSTLKKGDVTDVFLDRTREGKEMFKIILMKSKTDAHTADLVKDYVKIQGLALQKKKEETIAKWTKDKIGDTYIKINKDYSNCDFKNNWKKESPQ